MVAKPCNWTVDTLATRVDALEKMLNERESVNQERFTAARERVEIAMTSAEKAIIKAETATERRFDSVNEFRQTLSDQAATFMSRAEFDVQHKNLLDRLNLLNDRVLNIEATARGKSGSLGLIASMALGVMSFLGVIASIIYTTVVILRH